MIVTNTFSGGMSQDVDPLLQGKQYRFAKNGRIRYNRKNTENPSIEDAIEGKTGDFAVMRGNKQVAQFCAGYDLKGSVEVREGAVLFLSDGLNTVIGLLRLRTTLESAEFTIIYSDKNDPNRVNNPFLRRNVSDSDGERLNIGHVTGYSVYENTSVQRIYFVDGKNQKRTFNLYDFFINGDLSKPYHYANNCDLVVSYPKAMSVHAMAEQPDAVLPMLRFRQRIQGRLKSGTYRIAARYKNKNGVKSPFSILSPLIFVTNQPLEDASSTDMTLALQSNHHNRTMADKNGVETTEGIRWDIIDIDSRWDEIEVAYIYYQTSEIHSEAAVFYRAPIYGDRQTVIDLTANGPVGAVYYPISAEEIAKTFQTVLKTGYTQDYQGRSWDANLELLPDLRLNLSEVEIRPCYQYLRPDSTIEPKFDYVENKVTGRYDNDPLTNTVTENTQVFLSRYAGKVDSFPIINDRKNYKGQQVAAILKGHFRGEPYEYGAVIVDRKGNGLLVERIGSFTFPQQFDNYPLNTLTRKAQDGKYDTRILGAKISGIKIPIENLYDDNGNLNVSGIHIVRKQRAGQLKRQGVIFPTVMGPKFETKTADDGWVKPVAFPFNNYRTGYSPMFRGDSHTYLQGLGTKNDKPGWWEFQRSQTVGWPSDSTPYIFNFHSPDVLIEGTLEADTKGAYLRQVGHAHQAYTSNAVQLSGDKNYHLYTKSYRTEHLGAINPALEALYTNQGRPAMGEKSRIKWAFRHTKSEDTLYEKFDTDFWQFDYQAQTDMFRMGFDYPCFGIQQPGSVVLRAEDWKSVDISETNGDRIPQRPEDEKSCSYRIVNWYGQTQETSPNYFSTGYYLPITAETLSELRLEKDATGKPVAYVIDDAEVFGGDCYVSLFDFTRIYAGLDSCEKNPDRSAATFPDTACSHIIPIETKYNLDLRFGRKFAANATSVATTYCAGGDLQFSNGIMIRQPEDWNYNKSLMVEETIKFFQQRPQDVNYIASRPSSVMWSPKKLLGEELDRYRMKLPTDFADVEGNHGPIAGLVKAFDYLYYIRENAFGVILANQRTFIPSDQGEIQISSGQVFSGVRVLGNYGTKFPRSVWAYQDRFGFADTIAKKIVGFSQAGRDITSETNNVDDLVRALAMNVDGMQLQDTYYDIVAGIDRENSETLYSFFGSEPQKNVTLYWNMPLSCFVGITDVTAHTYAPMHDYLFSARNQNAVLYLHNYGKFGHFYGTYYDTVLRFVVNPSPVFEKLFSNGHILGTRSLLERLHTVKAWTDDETHTIPCVVLNGSVVEVEDDRFNFQVGRLSFPLHEWDWLDTKKPLKGHKLMVELTIKNSFATADQKDLGVYITSFDTNYRPSYPNQL